MLCQEKFPLLHFNAFILFRKNILLRFKTFEMEVSTFACSNRDQFVICLVLAECPSAKMFSISDSLRLAKREDNRLACFLFFLFFGLFFGS